VTMHDDLSGRVVVVTGASSGIGEATARLFAAHRASVVVGYHRDRAAAERVVAALPPGDHMAVQITIDDGASVRAAAETVAQRFGRTDVLVNSAGSTVMVPAGDLDALTDETFDQVTRINLRGPFAVIRAFRPLLEKTPQGVVVNISSAAALTGVGSNLAYCAAKAGLDALTLALAKVLGPRIRILSVSPAAVDTDFVKGRDPERLRKIAETTPLRHVTTADDVARAVLACVTHLGSATGTSIIVDEGRHL
jgi:3-oxoacyl-[acyl-carrier protein] reductase